jgi:hypothetical protein
MADRICLITNTLADQTVNQFIINAIGDWDGVDVIAQKEMEQEAIYLGDISGIYKGKFGIPENIFGRELYKSLNKKGRITTFTNLESWKNFVEGANICISSRFHGAVASMMSGVPTMVIPIDSRMRELCSYHKLAAVDKNSLNGVYVEDILGNIDFDAWKTVWKDNRDHFVSFLDKNGISHTLGSTGECAYDRIAKTIDWEAHVDNWNELSIWKKIVRTEDYFVGKMRSRFDKNSIIRNGDNV